MKQKPVSWRMGAVLLSGAVACGSSSSPGPAVSASGTDGGVPEASAQDTGNATDGRAPDGGTQDSGSPSTTDASTSSDASMPTGPAACGAGYCRGQEVCVSNACVYQGCVGVQVPADFPTVAAAVTSLMLTGGTVCVAAGTYPGTVEINGSVDVTIIGVSAADVTLTGGIDITFGGRPAPPPQFQTITIQGVALTGGVVEIGLTGDYGIVNLTDCGMAGGVSASTAGGLAVTAKGGQLAVNVTASRFTSVSCMDGTNILSTGEVTLTLDGVDLGAAGLEDLYVETYSASSKYVLQNSYLHDGTTGALFSSQFGLSSPSASFTVVNNTFARNQTGLGLTDEGLTVTLFNNIFVGSMFAYDGTVSVPASSSGEDAYFDDVNDYEGMAAAGTGDVTANPLLDTSTPPGLMPGSPCRGTANKSQAPAKDYWGRSRPASVDIGAVQSSP